ASPVRRPATAATPILVAPDPLHDSPNPSALRVQSFVEIDRQWLVMTRRTALDSGDLADLSNPSNRFLGLTAPHLLDLAAALPTVRAGQPLPAVPGSRPPRVVRLYALSEDGTLVSLPVLPVTTGPFDPAASRQAALIEGRGFRDSPERPTFVSNEFYFRFN